MRRFALLTALALALIEFSATNFLSIANSAPPKAEDDFQLVKVADGVYAAIAKPGGLASGNAGFIVGDAGVMMVDTFFTPAAVEKLIGEIATQTKQPIKFAVNTHYHLDHTGGNQVLAARGVPIIAHDNVVYVPDANVIFTGDMGWSRTLPNLVDATVIDWIKSLDRLLADHPGARFIPGHVEVATAVEMREFRDYLDELRGAVRRMIDEGLTIEQAKEQWKLPEKYKGFAFQNFAKPNIEDMHKELTGTKNTK